MGMSRCYVSAALTLVLLVTLTSGDEQPVCPEDKSLVITQEPVEAVRTAAETRLTCTFYRPDPVDFQALLWSSIENNNNIFEFLQGNTVGTITEGAGVVEAGYDNEWNPGTSYVVLNTTVTNTHEYKCEFFLQDHMACMSQTVLHFQDPEMEIKHTLLNSTEVKEGCPTSWSAGDTLSFTAQVHNILCDTPPSLTLTVAGDDTVEGEYVQSDPTYPGGFCSVQISREVTLGEKDFTIDFGVEETRITATTYNKQLTCVVPDPCASHPCQNSAPCLVTGLSSYSCECASAWYTGHNCSQVVCPVNTCLNEGNCSASSEGVFSCSCPPAYTGDTCTQAVSSGSGEALAGWSVALIVLFVLVCVVLMAGGAYFYLVKKKGLKLEGRKENGANTYSPKRQMNQLDAL